MPDRLTIEIYRNSICDFAPFATTYYRWGANTVAAISATRSLCKHVLQYADRMSDKELALALIRCMEKTDIEFDESFDANKSSLQPRTYGGLYYKEFEWAQQTFPCQNFYLYGNSSSGT